MTPAGPRPKLPLAARWLLLSLGLHLLAAWLMNGHYHCDEHFQVVEFAGLKLGLTQPGLLAWEYAAHIRPWLQPGLYVLLWRAGQLLGMQNPLSLLFLLRLATGLLAWAALAAAALALQGQLRTRLQRRVLWLLVGSYWFFAYLDVRTSSENLGGLLFYAALAPVLAGGAELSGPALLAVGALAGLSFNARYQMALMLVGLAAWLLVRARRRARVLLLAGAGTLAAEVLCALLDRWGYGAWSFPAVDYFRVNLMEGKAAQFGTSPWWSYFQESLANDGPGGLLLYAAMFAFWVRRPGHVLTWCTAPFFAAHLLLAHKEGRFMNPLILGQVLMVPLLVPEGLLFRAGRRWGARAVRRGGALLTATVLGANAIGLGLAVVTTHYTQIDALDALAQRPGEPVYYAGTSPYESCGLQMVTLRPPGLSVTAAPDEARAFSPEPQPSRPWRVARRGWSQAPEAPLPPGCQPEFHTLGLVPALEGLAGRELEWVRARWSGLELFQLYRCQPRPRAAPGGHQLRFAPSPAG